MDAVQEARFLDSFTIDDGCWEWTGSYRPNGYGRFWTGDHRPQAHRVAYEYWVGPIPDGLQINHLCENKGCVNPDHLALVTAQENVMYSDTPARRNSRKTHCPVGHPFDTTNTYLTAGRRHCRSCRRDEYHRNNGYERNRSRTKVGASSRR